MRNSNWIIKTHYLHRDEVLKKTTQDFCEYPIRAVSEEEALSKFGSHVNETVIDCQLGEIR